MHPSATPVHRPTVAGRSMIDARVEMDTEAIDQLIARVLRRATLEANALDDRDEARAILDVAHSFADELATADPRFDRLRFIEDATEDRS